MYTVLTPIAGQAEQLHWKKFTIMLAGNIYRTICLQTRD